MRYQSSLIMIAAIIAAFVMTLAPPKNGSGQHHSKHSIDSIEQAILDVKQTVDIAEAKVDRAASLIKKNENSVSEIWQLSKKIKNALAKIQAVKVIEKPVYIKITDPFYSEVKKENDSPIIYGGTPQRDFSDYEKQENKGLWYKLFKKKKQ